eukprot:scaffold3625_cov179-Ochromonas_danica.AAC.14
MTMCWRTTRIDTRLPWLRLPRDLLGRTTWQSVLHEAVSADVNRGSLSHALGGAVGVDDTNPCSPLHVLYLMLFLLALWGNSSSSSSSSSSDAGGGVGGIRPPCSSSSG